MNQIIYRAEYSEDAYQTGYLRAWEVILECAEEILPVESFNSLKEKFRNCTPASYIEPIKVE